MLVYFVFFYTKEEERAKRELAEKKQQNISFSNKFENLTDNSTPEEKGDEDE